jgi:hypothetical protein
MLTSDEVSENFGSFKTLNSKIQINKRKSLMPMNNVTNNYLRT